LWRICREGRERGGRMDEGPRMDDEESLCEMKFDAGTLGRPEESTCSRL
jgi:hypothetical protein